MSDEKNEGQAKPRSTESIKGWFPDTAWSFWCFGVTVAMAIGAWLLHAAGIIDDGWLHATWCVSIGLLVVLMLIGMLLRSFDDSRVDKRKQKLITEFTPSTTATEELTGMSFDKLLADAEQRKSSKPDAH